MKNIKIWLSLIILMVTFGCKTNIDTTVSYTPIYRESKGLRHTFLLDKSGLIWVMNFTKHCLPILPDIEISFTKEVPYKRFVIVPYKVIETRGYNCDGDFAIIVHESSTLEALLRTHYIRSIKVNTMGGGPLIISMTNHSKQIFNDIAKLDWKTPIPKIEEIDTRGLNN